MSRWPTSLILGCLVFSTTSSLASNVSPYIIDGSDASKSDWPYITALAKKNQSAYSGQFCGGSYIGNRYVLTAAHCVEDFSKDDFDVIVGVNNLNNESFEGARIEVDRIYIHPYYSATSLVNDIAILELTRAVTSNEATPVSLAGSSTRTEIADGTMLTVAGWGTTNPALASPTSPAQLMQVDVPLVNQNSCANVYAGVSTSSFSENFCAGTTTEGQDSCRGDSGGPIVIKSSGVQLGIVSYGKTYCGQQGSYGVYTNISKYSDWISQHTSGFSYDDEVFIGYKEVGNFSHTFQYNNSSSDDITITRSGLQGIGIKSPDTCETKGTIKSGDSCQVTVTFPISDYTQNEFVHVLSYDQGGKGYFANSTIVVEGAISSNDALPQALSLPAASAYGNNNPWQVFSSNTLRSAPITHSEKSTLILDGIPSGSYEFDVRLASESTDLLYLYVNGESKGGVGGERSFTHQLSMSKVSNRLKFEYVKDSTIDVGEDAVYISNFRTAGSSTSASTSSGGEGGGSGGSISVLSLGLILMSLRRGQIQVRKKRQ
ncbi:trypsin [Vibrio coralliilyticus]|uniref:S1 family peptidase n=1 Tax=Vibrio coralliilyticus TaxID=190893 RepID=UPI0008108B99|nr:serine protease [Vibrio coralliilyticus]ANW26716.1 trypsin [Vibrio coralliilyticus]